MDFCKFEAGTHDSTINHLGNIFQISLSSQVMESRLLAQTDWHPAEDESKKVFSSSMFSLSVFLPFDATKSLLRYLTDDSNVGLYYPIY